MEFIVPLLIQCPVIGVFSWVLITMTRDNRKEKQELVKQFQDVLRENRQEKQELVKQFQDALDKVVSKIGERLDRIETALKSHVFQQ